LLVNSKNFIILKIGFGARKEWERRKEEEINSIISIIRNISNIIIRIILLIIIIIIIITFNNI
jgi:hypothetical protein